MKERNLRYILARGSYRILHFGKGSMHHFYIIYDKTPPSLHPPPTLKKGLAFAIDQINGEEAAVCDLCVWNHLFCIVKSLTCHPVFRFYNKLPEVKKQREEEQRKKAYSTNRDKAKEYQQVLHNICYSHTHAQGVKQWFCPSVCRNHNVMACSRSCGQQKCTVLDTHRPYQ